MDKRKWGIAAVVLILALCFGAAQQKKKIAFDIPPVSETYLYIESILPSQKVKLSAEEQERLLDILHEIRYQKPSIDLSAEKYAKYGFSYCAAEFVTNDGKKQFYISNYEVEPGIRKVYYSDFPSTIPAYISESLYLEYEALFRNHEWEAAG